MQTHRGGCALRVSLGTDYTRKVRKTGALKDVYCTLTLTREKLFVVAAWHVQRAISRPLQSLDTDGGDEGLRWTSRVLLSLDVGPEEAQCQRTRRQRGGGAGQLDESREKGFLNCDAAADWLRRGTCQVCDWTKTASGCSLFEIGEHAGESSWLNFHQASLTIDMRTFLSFDDSTL